MDNITDKESTVENIRDKLKKCGTEVRIYPLSRICKPEVIELDDHCRICDFVFIWGGDGVRIGKYTDIQPQSVIWGGGEIFIGDYVSIGPGVVFLTGVYSYREGLRMVDGQPQGKSRAIYGKLVINNDVYIGANCTLMPNITVGEGAVIGANSFVNKDIESWSINVGSPCRKISVRPKAL